MKLASYRSHGDARIGAVVADRVVDLAAVVAALPRRGERFAGSPGMLALLQSGSEALGAAARYVDGALANAQAHPLLRDVELLAPLPRPGKIIAVGRNYADHAAETGMKPMQAPRIIAKLSSSVAGPGVVVVRPPGVAKLDYECELAVVMGAPAKNVKLDHALQAVAGYTILDDVSAREFQFDVSPAQTTFAKSMDGFCPMGPWLVTRDEIPDPQALAIRTRLNGEVVQDASTRDMTFSVAALIEYISRYMTLEPGDLIATGTPAGVGAFRTPPRWLQPGDHLALEIEKIGVLEHAIG
jgi:2-keto-4-pentenoate hydratase/2-oxohepta-3-ene-1,7-dioic acid hydratase in catechol pathway